MEENLDPKVLKEVARICDLDLDQLTPENVAFLKARISYLTGKQLSKFESVLSEKKTQAKEPIEVIGKKKK